MATKLTDDGLRVLDIRSWTLQKYELVGRYVQQFATSMKNHWDKRAYIDLFSGPGRSRYQGRVIAASPTLALSVRDPFDTYIFCEKDAVALAALSARAKRDFPDRDVHTVSGDANECVDDVIRLIPPYESGEKVLSFCLLDPFRLSDLKFRTLQALSSRYMDFLVLIATGMDASRNADRYLTSPGSTPLDEALGTRDWRPEWQRCQARGETFDGFIGRYFTERMQTISRPYGQTVSIRFTDDKNQRLYRLGFFSRHPLGLKFFRHALEYAQGRDLFDGGA